MIYGIGTDIVSIDRFRRFVDDGNISLLQRLFTDRELAFCNARKTNADCLAARFAAKEAFLKALGCGLRDGICWLDMEVANNEQGKPDLLLTGKALEIFREKKLSRTFLSLSHDGGKAIAMVILESL